jgi:hypothetical protein
MSTSGWDDSHPNPAVIGQRYRHMIFKAEITVLAKNHRHTVTVFFKTDKPPAISKFMPLSRAVWTPIPNKE